jgi:hypothetical protein
VARGDQPLRRQRLPAIFCIENNQIALSTPLSSQSAVRVFADKARGYGIPESRSTAPIRTRCRGIHVGGDRARAGLGRRSSSS